MAKFLIQYHGSVEVEAENEYSAKAMFFGENIPNRKEHIIKTELLSDNSPKSSD